MYYTRFLLSTSFGSVKSRHQAGNKNFKNGNPVCYVKELSPLHREYIINVYKTGRYIVYIYTGHTQKNGAVSIYIQIETAPFFCVCPVYMA
jgi:hypothetical protein